LEAYQAGILKAVQAVRAAGAKAIVMTPPPFDPASFTGGNLQPESMASYSWKAPYQKYNDTLLQYAAWIKSLGSEVDGAVNTYDLLSQGIENERKNNPAYSSGDGIHPNAKGHWLIAKKLLSRLFNITLEREPDYVEHPEHSAYFKLILERHRLLSSAWKEHIGHTNPTKADALPLKEALVRSSEIEQEIKRELAKESDPHMEHISHWNGYKQKDFYLNGREGIVICPEAPAAGSPYIWRAEFLHAFDYADRALLEQGWHIVYYRLSHMYGCPHAVELMREFQAHIETAYGLSNRAVLFGFSRGGLYTINYASAHPDKVAAIYLDAPVLDIRSWPGGKGEGVGSSECWEDCKAIYGITESEAADFNENPLDKLEKVVQANIPIIIVAGDSDRVVPFSENGEKWIKRYIEYGGTIEVIVKPGVDHHPHSLENPVPIVKFITGFIQ
jgi:pimeloyl-ACP methyl ester carboxylesterase